MVWDPQQYEKFRDQRAEPFRDLVALLEPCDGARVIDVGCGTGALTHELHRQLGAAETLGIDNSAEMLARSQTAPGVVFRCENVETLSERCDVVFSNAALHWISDQRGCLSRLRNWLNPGGQLAGQVPANHDHISHLVADEIAAEEPFCGVLDGYRRGTPVLDPREYAEILHELGFVRHHVRLQIYGHVLGSVNDVVEWVKGALLTVYRDRLSLELYDRFLATYRQRLFERVGSSGEYFYTYKRILFWGRLAT